MWRESGLPAYFGATLDFAATSSVELQFEIDAQGGARLILSSGTKLRGSVTFPASGAPRIGGPAAFPVSQ